ncbi:DUF3302 domain-containing protein [Klebsiella huaxiensis]|uniref:DUF3302 domain-containing protein n=1 Tax=Klebsiella huaxiensis TaxID=2153354 RepID=A0A564KM97_9ENTR|nr:MULTISPECIES: DUF3302 domain-containing protein [Klebsiella]MDG1640372.1 DUF3302 domain-containing protein [Klebsiella huaxiensis]QBG05715.1 DUF3302 domain-containing protein [Klebsiella huaxiensis]VUS70353.1 Inner membrane protein YiaW [Klebsiella huaxiensis]VUT07955.1 Inner membrane protein YiaW [Klebsiella huaxiensis]
MFLNYFALGVLIFVFLVIFYGIIILHDIPYLIAKKRNHPHSDAIHVAGWVSLFTLHVIWPFLWIWATLYQPERGWGMQHRRGGVPPEATEDEDEISELRQRVSALEQRITDLQPPAQPPSVEK